MCVCAGGDDAVAVSAGFDLSVFLTFPLSLSPNLFLFLSFFLSLSFSPPPPSLSLFHSLSIYIIYIYISETLSLCSRRQQCSSVSLLGLCRWVCLGIDAVATILDLREKRTGEGE